MSERTNPHPARVGRAGGKGISRASDFARRKVVAIEFEVVAIDFEIVAIESEIVAIELEVVAHTRMMPLIEFVPCRTCARSSRCI